MPVFQFSDVLWVLAVALFVVTLAGVIATGAVVVAMGRRYDQQLHVVERDHARKVARIEDENAREKGVLLARITTLEGQVAMMVSLLQGRGVLTSRDAVQITANRSDSNQVLSTMQQLFNREELEVLARSAGLKLDDVGGEGLPVVAQRLLEAAERTSRYQDLVSAIKRARPNAAI